MTITHLKFRAVKQESDDGYYRVSLLTGGPSATHTHRGDLLLTPAEWEILYCKLIGSILGEGIYGRVLVVGALPPSMREETTDDFARYEKAVKACADDGECPSCWDVYYERAHAIAAPAIEADARSARADSAVPEREAPKDA